MPTWTDYEVAPYRSSWSVVASATAADATATKTGVPNTRHFLVTVDASYSSSATSGLLTVRFGTNVVAQKTVHGAGAFDFTFKGLAADVGQDISATLAAGGAGIVGHVTITGFSLPETSTVAGSGAP